MIRWEFLESWWQSFRSFLREHGSIEPPIEPLPNHEIEADEPEADPAEWLHMWMGALFGRTDACDRVHISCNLEVLEHAGAEEEEEVGGENKEGCAPEEHELRQQRHLVPLSGACDFP